MPSDPPEANRGSVNPRYENFFREIEAKFEASNILSEKWYLRALGYPPKLGAIHGRSAVHVLAQQTCTLDTQ
jgi:hypothetical protein